MSLTSNEIAGQPAAWTRAAADGARASLPAAGASMLLLGCGTSAFVAHAMARLRDAAGQGPTDWCYASELPVGRRYEHLLAISRSGTTTEILQALDADVAKGAKLACVTAVPGTPVPDRCDQVVALSYADESSIVQTRFPTTTLVHWRAALGEDLGGVIEDGRTALAAPLPVDVTAYDHFVFLGRGWTVGLADEAALKMRECAQAWSESYPALDYRHGPIAVAGPTTLVVSLGGVDAGLLDEVRATTGATVVDEPLDPLARLITCQRLAVAAAEAKHLDVDRPRNLTRSVILSPLEESR
ncbi:SIS domain-containing protein [Nocardioides mangrovi]|uniref:SIS domain-containing protein n=1 Tax=Nocardioides mangrovi TaxID=2874580 RepID=A0ABS7UCW2_9ACTN|nr:SIS domain-containing protein [Nocardioides mangrovi]MBZ5738727.1 SIS domain-containing protein [Nocardioides mangrovi]